MMVNMHARPRFLNIQWVAASEKSGLGSVSMRAPIKGQTNKQNLNLIFPPWYADAAIATPPAKNILIRIGISS